MIEKIQKGSLGNFGTNVERFTDKIDMVVPGPGTYEDINMKNSEVKYYITRITRNLNLFLKASLKGRNLGLKKIKFLLQERIML